MLPLLKILGFKTDGAEKQKTLNTICFKKWESRLVLCPTNGDKYRLIFYRVCLQTREFNQLFSMSLFKKMSVRYDT